MSQGVPCETGRELIGLEMTAPPLKRVIGVGALTLLGINFIVGSGVFGLPGLVAGALGPAAVLAYLIVAVLMTLVGLCFAEVGSRVTGAGGLYAYADAAFGPVVGGVAGTLVWLANSVVPSAALANLWVDTAGGFSPAVAGPVARIIVFCAFYAMLAIINVRGVEQGTRLAAVLAAVKLAPLLALLAVGLFAIHGSNLGWNRTPTLPKLGEAAVLVFFSFMGTEGALTASGEIKTPARTIPLAVLLALSFVAILYVGLQEVSQGVLGGRLAGSPSPLVAVASAIMGPWGGRAIGVALLLSLTGYLTADMAVSPRTLYAMAERRQLPKGLAAVHPRFDTPATAILVYAAACVLVACTGSFRQLVLVASSGTLTLYLICCLGLLRLRAKCVAMDGEPFRAPGGWFVPLAASAIILWLLSTLKWQELIAVAAMVLVSGAIYALPRRRLSVSPVAG